MTEVFHEKLNKTEFMKLLKQHFLNVYEKLSETDIVEVKKRLKKRKLAGQPIDKQKIELFEYAYALNKSGKTIKESVRIAFEKFPDVTIKYRKIPDDSDHDINILIDQYKRYKRKKKSGIDPATAYSIKDFFELILEKKWKLAVSIYINYSTPRRKKICNTLNDMLKRRNVK